MRSLLGLSSCLAALDITAPEEASMSLEIHSSGSRPVAWARSYSCLA